MSEIDEVCACFMHVIASNLLIDLGHLIFNLIHASSLENTIRGFLLFGLLVTEFLGAHQIELEPYETHISLDKPISQKIL